MTNDRFNINRVGQAAVATTAPGRVPSYGLAYDLGTANYIPQGQYQTMIRDFAQRNADAEVQRVAELVQSELERARNYQEFGFSVANDDLRSRSVGATSWRGAGLEDAAELVHTGGSLAGNLLGQVGTAVTSDAADAAKLIPVVGGWLGGMGVGEGNEYEDDGYSTYKALGGILPRSDFENFDPETQQYLMSRAEAQGKLRAAVETPGIKHALAGLEAGYRGLQTPFIMLGNQKHKNPLTNLIDPNWFNGGEWSKAWRESQDQSLGNSIVNGILEPYVGQERLDKWKRDSSIYQLSSLGVEMGAAWVADPGVLALKGTGGVTRFARGEMPLNEQGKLHKATTQALQREQITVRGPAAAYGRFQAKRINHRWEDVQDFARTRTFGEFSSLPMFSRRAGDGQAAAAALYWAFRNAERKDVDLSAVTDQGALFHQDIPTLTRQLLHGDPKAYADLELLKRATPEELNKFAPGVQTYIDAVEATKTRIDSLAKEAEELAKVDPKSPFHEWSVHTELDQRIEDMAEATFALKKYEGYGRWMDNVNRAPSISRVGAKRHIFMDNQFGKPHVVLKWMKPGWIQKANIASMHDADSGAMSIRRQFDQFSHLFGYRNTEALDGSLAAWMDAPTAYDRYNVLRRVEEEHLIAAAAQKFEVEPEVIRAIYDKVLAEQNRVLDGVRRGEDTIYESAPGLQQRIGERDQIRLLERDPENESVTLQLMDSGRVTTITVHESALSPKGGAIDPTQTPNYYQPVDTRRFYLELKRNRDLIRTMSHAKARSGAAWTAEAVDWAGTTFNALWKPMVLFRFGWPQRVLMDENMRALAVLGIPAFTKYYGSDYARALNNATVKVAGAANNTFKAALVNPFVKKKVGRDEFPIGAGPLSDRVNRYTMDPVLRDTEVVNTPQIPESMLPVLDNARYAKVSAHIAAWDEHEALANKAWAWRERLPETPPASELNEIQRRALESGIEAIQKDRLDGEYPETPIRKILLRRMDQGLEYHAKPHVHDPITTREETTGLAVPLPHTKANITRETPRLSQAWASWYKEHSELLSSTGYRIMFDTDGSAYVARIFPNRNFKKAREMAEFMGSGKIHNLRNGEDLVLKDWNDLTPTEEAAYRQFRSERPIEKVEGDAPYGGPKRLEGPKTLYHGTGSDLPENLLPRDATPVASGRMVGEGLYTTTSEEVATGYGHNLYVLRGSKDGRTYKIFDLDKTPSQAEIRRLIRWMQQHPENATARGFDTYADRLKNLIDRSEVSLYSGSADGSWKWVDLMATLDYTDPQIQRMLTEYFEQVHGAGALSHLGGFNTGNAGGHRVYVWLRPENLEVKAAYAPGDRYVPLIEWLYHPLSKEVPIPENRIIRTGRRNPLFRELHTLHRQIEARGGVRRSFASDPEVRAMILREQEMMHTLGLEYTHNVTDGKPNQNIGQDWYVMTDPERFGRMNRERDAAAVAGGDLRAQEVGAEDIDPDFSGLDMEIDSVHNAVLRAVWKRRESGKGFVSTKSSDGIEVYYPSAYEGHDGELMRTLVGSQGAIESLSDGHGAATSLFRKAATGHRTYTPPVMDDAAKTKGTPEYREAVEYFNQWGDLLNSQVAHSPIWNKMLNGWSDERIANWLDNTPEGAAIRRELGHKYQDTELWVNEHRAKLDYYLPNKKLQRLLGKGKIAPSQLRKEVHEEDRPDVFGPDIEFLSKPGTKQTLNWIADRIWYGLGTVPIDTLSRHPFARAMYDLKMKSLVNTTNSQWLDAKTLTRFEGQARRYAENEVRKTLWNLVDQTNFADALRFMAPFWAAQSEAIVKWAKIVSDRPETVARAFTLNRAVYQNFMVIDEDGQPTGKKFFDYSPTDRVVLRIPSVMRKTSLGKALETIGTVGIPIGSANTVLQGENPILPGPGPLVTITADKLLRAVSDTGGVEYSEEGLYRWLFPIGRPQHGGIQGVLDQVMPGWGKRVMQYNEGDDGIAYSNLFAETAREMTLENQRKGLPDPTPAEIEKQVRWIWGLRAVAGLVSPVQTQFRPKHQFFIDEYRRYMEQYGPDAFDRFVTDYGQAMARYTASSSNSTVGVPPTNQGMEDWSNNKQLIQQFPEWGAAIVSPDAYNDEFSSDAYYAQFDLNLGPGDDTPLREGQSMKERFDKADTRSGWFEFRKVDAILDAELMARGLHSLQQTGAEDLAEIKRNFIADLTSRNAAWRADYDNFNNDIYSRVAELQQWAFRSEFDQRPDIQGVRQYLLIRDQVAAELDRNAAQTGGSRSLEAVENTALRDWFYQQVGQLAQANPAFAEFYTRYLSQDTLSQGSGGF